MIKVAITRKIPDTGIELLKKHFKQVALISKGDFCNKKQLLKEIKNADALLSLLTEKIDQEVIDTGKNLKIIANYAVGYNNIDVDYATGRGIYVTNTPGILTETTADFAFTLLMSTARRVGEAERFSRAGKFKSWGPRLLCGQDIHGKTLGIIGMGRIGRAVATRAALGFDMNILYSDNSVSPKLPFAARKVELQELLQESDFISLHVPFLESTFHLIGEKELAMMKPTAVLINTSRGPVIDEKALIRALQQKQLFAAGLDVFENEPQIPRELKKLDNIIITPHIGSASVETRDGMAEMAAQNIIDFFNGKTPGQLVNKKVLKQG
ncbi:MAG: D-glycerate dehydrogenase [bacterium]